LGKDDLPEQLVVLEAPPADELSSPAIEGLFNAESLATVMAKASALDTFLTVAARDLAFNDFMREILLCFMRVVKCEAGSIFELNPQEQSLFFRAMVGRSSDLLSKYRVPVGHGVVGHVAESRQTLVVNDGSQDPRHLKAIEQEVDFQVKNMIAVPLVIRGQLYGVLELLNRIGEESFTTSDVDLLNYLSQMAAKAIEIRMMIAWGAQRAEGRAGQEEAA